MRRLHYILAILLMVSCSRHTAGHDGIVILVNNDPGTLDPRLSTGAFAAKINALVFEGLTSIDASLLPEPALAERIVADGTQVLVTIKKNAKFADGRPVTAEDVRYTFWTVMNEKPRRSSLKYTWRDLVRVEVVDRRTARLVFERPHPRLMYDLTMGILPSHYLRKHGHVFEPGTQFGAGPYRVESIHAGTVTLVANPYYRRKVSHPRLEVRTVEDENVRALLMASGAADLAQNVVSPLVVPALRRKGLQVKTGPSVILTYIGFNTDATPLNDVRVRRAIAMALDRREMIRARFVGLARLADSVLPSLHWAHAGTPIPYDPEGARRLLDEAGYPDPPGPAPRFTLEYKTSSDPFRVALARLIALQLRKVGIDVRVRSYEWSVFFGDVKHRRFQMISLQMTGLVQPYVMCWFFKSSMIPHNGKGGLNRWGMRSDVVDRACAGLERVVDRATQARLAREIQNEVMRLLPIVPLWHEDNVAIVSSRLRDYTLYPDARFSF